MSLLHNVLLFTSAAAAGMGVLAWLAYAGGGER